MYLSSRLPLPVNSNPFFLFPRQLFCSDEQMLLFATRIIEFSVQYKFKIDQQTLSQDLGSGQGKGKWLCMETYKHFFHSYRMPHADRDKLLVQSRRSNHIVVASRNQFFVLYLGDEPLEDPYSCDPRQATLPTAKIYQQLVRIYRLSREPSRVDAPKIGLLTTEGRSTWASLHKLLTCELTLDARATHAGAPSDDDARLANRASLQQIEDCLFVMCLDSSLAGSDANCPSGSTNAKLGVERFASQAEQVDAATVILTGGGSARHSANRWFDKFLQVVVGRDGVCGINVEHSASEGMTVLRFVNEFFDYLSRCATLSPLQLQEGVPSAADDDADDNRTVDELSWHLNGELRAAIAFAERKINALVADFSLVILNFELFGRDFIKSQSVSPDAFVQLALQFTYFKCHGTLVSTYESGSLRQFKFGRVDNIRANSVEALAWIQAMLWLERAQDSAADRDQRLKTAARLFKAALDKQLHVLRYTITGQGPDNHLLALKQLSADRFDALPALFTDESYGEFLRFKLSTSQLPNEAGVTVGYGAVLPDGYGCSYNPMRARIVFCVSCFESCSETSAQKFAATLNSCLLSMQQLCACFD